MEVFVCKDVTGNKMVDCSDPRTWSATHDPVELSIGDCFVVKAEENPSTGFGWLVLDEELEYHGLTGVVKAGLSRYEPGAAATSMVGVPGTRFLEIQALKMGQGILHIILGRPWEVKEAFRKNEVYEPVGDIKIQIKVTDAKQKDEAKDC